LDDLISNGYSLCDLSLSWIHLMVLEYVVEKLE